MSEVKPPEQSPLPVGKDQPLQVEVKEGILSISIGIETFKYCVNNYHDYDTFNFDITDADGFAKEVVRELEREQEDGTTPVHILLDKAANDAVDNGSQFWVERKKDKE